MQNKSLLNDSQIKVDSEVLWSEMGSEAVLLNLKSGVYFGTNDVGQRIWQLLQGSQTFSSLIKTITDEYDCDEENIKEDLKSFISDLQKQNLITMGDAQ